ncbi:hypothetical protein GN109_24120 [Collimonas pratensis]|uniref:helix-turn-helix domain-containing protein n=1 Tax=Collimonas pratensis TaxID=279113 RepID=UPI00143DCF2A|nr:helix-turn-helix domain-containing protein [Collimonas pratensis]NKI72514.1 hypothetical protein [Collimonas pratensis]
MSDQQNLPDQAHRIQQPKERMILAMMQAGRSLNRFEAEQYGDHCLHSTISTLRNKGYRINDTWEKIPTRFGKIRVKRYTYVGLPE